MLEKGDVPNSLTLKKREATSYSGSVKTSWKRWSLSLALKNKKDDMAAYQILIIRQKNMGASYE